jgi:hypothetical protein
MAPQSLVGQGLLIIEASRSRRVATKIEIFEFVCHEVKVKFILMLNHHAIKDIRYDGGVTPHALNIAHI